MIEFSCKNCGEKVKRFPSRYRKGSEFCNMKCRCEYIAKQNEKECETCGEVFIAKNKNRRFCSHECATVGNSGEKAFSWKGGIYNTTQGYRAIKIDGKYVLEHRLIAESVLGRPLKRKEVVHHVDGNKKNNCHTNLVIMEKHMHDKLHMEMRHASNAQF
jgi:hypothetical protein